MPIRLNLLAEAQAAEEQRRRDPVKRAIWVAALLISLMLVWSSSLQLKSMLAKKDLGRVQAQINSRTNEYQKVLNDEEAGRETKFKLASLDRLATNRFLNGTMLNTLQKTTVDDVRLIHVRAYETYEFVEATKPRTNNNRVVPGKPAVSTERVLITLDGSDYSPNPGDQVNKYQEALLASEFFRNAPNKTNTLTLKQFGTQVAPESGRSTVLFTLESRYSEKTYSEKTR